jgi:hypothetical protein
VLAAVMLVIAALTGGTARHVPRARAADGPPVIAAVGDIACKDPPKQNRRVCQYDDVAATIERGGYDAFLALGDIQYEYGEYRNFVENYDAYFHDLLPITYPVPGNHDYGTADARGYFRYFGDAARSDTGYYSFDVGAWHLIALNSAVCPAATGCGPGDPQYDWLREDLAQSDASCTLAYWHHPRFDWLKYQHADWTEDYEWLRTKPFWDALYAAGADVVLAGHNHNYSRWHPMDDRLRFDPERGITQFIAGMGGRNLNDLGSASTRPATFATGFDQGFGVLELTLRARGYDWRFVPARSGTDYIDEGSRSCH